MGCGAFHGQTSRPIILNCSQKRLLEIAITWFTEGFTLFLASREPQVSTLSLSYFHGHVHGPWCPSQETSRSIICNSAVAVPDPTRMLLLEGKSTEKGPSVSPRWASRTVESTTGRETPRGLHLAKAKVWWDVVHAQLRPIGNDNTLSPSLASLVACFMAGYPINVKRIIAIEMRDRALNERAELPFPCLIGKLCRQANIPPNRLVDRCGDAFRLTQASKIKHVSNHLFGAKSGAVGSLVVVPHVPIDIPHADRGPDQRDSSQRSTEAPPPPTLASQAPATFVTIPMLLLEKLVAN
uniref:Putative plant transposon protein domain-containing protein n=1 Tax=Solanum tuberosum TaxID=4113 RepID=M1E0A1_SOLTU